jgi:hypothetical protein
MIMWTYHIGVVCTYLGLGMLLVRHAFLDTAEPLLTTSIGLLICGVLLLLWHALGIYVMANGRKPEAGVAVADER